MKNILRKLGSVKVWIALWSMALITFIVLKNLSAFNNLAMLAVTPIVRIWRPMSGRIKFTQTKILAPRGEISEV